MKQTRVMKALADETRLRLMNILLAAKVPLCVCEMVDALSLPQYQVSRHLLILKNAELVKVEKEGTWAYHSVEKENDANATVFEFLEAFLTSETFDLDRKQLERRLRLREDGKCIVGFPPEGKLSPRHFERGRMHTKERVWRA